MTAFKMIGGACLVAALAAASPAMARSGHHRSYHHGFARSVFAAAAIDGFSYYGGYTPRGENYRYYWDAGYVPESNYFSNSKFACQPGTIFFGEDGVRHLCE